MTLVGDDRYVAIAPTVLAAGGYLVSAVTTGGNTGRTNVVTPAMSKLPSASRLPPLVKRLKATDSA